jgi:hypothetical protein
LPAKPRSQNRDLGHPPTFARDPEVKHFVDLLLSLPYANA